MPTPLTAPATDTPSLTSPATDTTAEIGEIYFLDTSVLLAAGPRALWAFDEHGIVLPLVVITELESKRDDPDIG